MTTTRGIRNISLIGFMGTGKSSVGHLVASELGFTFLDTDHEIEARVGQSIRDIFGSHGEPAFRDLECRLVQELAQREQLVIATGGGLPINPVNLESLRSHSIVVCLWATPEKIFDRVKAHTHRPLLNAPDPLSKIRQLLAEREPYYRQADVLVNTEMRSLREIAGQIIHHFRMAQAASA